MHSIRRVPKHIGIIPDGNRRWAAAHGFPKEEGYEYGIEPGKRSLDEILRYGIREISIYAFTQENTRRPSRQVLAFQNAIVKLIDELKTRDDISILVIGDSSSRFFPKQLVEYTVPEKCRAQKTKVNFLVNYSWRWDLNMVSQNPQKRPFKKSAALENLGSKDVSRIDLVIRWGGRRRLSGFLPIQAAYADIYTVEDLWPDFQARQFHEALKWYEKQDVTLGG